MNAEIYNMLDKLGVRKAFTKNWCAYHRELCPVLNNRSKNEVDDVTYFTLYFTSCDVSFAWTSTPEGGDFWNGVCLAINCVIPTLEPLYKRTVLLLKKRKYAINFDDDFVKSMSKTLKKNNSKMQLTTMLLGSSIRDLLREYKPMAGAIIDSKDMANAINATAQKAIYKGYFIRKKKPTSNDWSFSASNSWNFPL